MSARLEGRAGDSLFDFRRESRFWFGIVKVRREIIEERFIVGVAKTAHFTPMLKFDSFPVPGGALTDHRTQRRVATAATVEQQIPTGASRKV